MVFEYDAMLMNIIVLSSFVRSKHHVCAYKDHVLNSMAELDHPTFELLILIEQSHIKILFLLSSFRHNVSVMYSQTFLAMPND